MPSNENETKVNITGRDLLKILWIGIKAAIVLFAIFQASNVTVLYQGF